MGIAKNLEDIRASIPEEVTLVAVSKTKPPSDIMEAYAAGHRVFGENKIQELVAKAEELPKDIEWHAIGHLQTNKVKYIAPFVSLIHAIDSLKLLKEVNKRALQHGRTIDCLLQIHIADEATKFGLSDAECEDLLRSSEFVTMKHVRITGLMGMATFTSNEDQIRREFAGLKQLFDRLQRTHPTLARLSMGMSGDYRIAIEEGSTMVRVGSAIFGARNYA